MNASSEDTDIHLLLKYPLITKQVFDDRIVYKGSIDVHEQVCKLEVIELPDKTFRFLLDENLKGCEQEFCTASLDIHPKNIITYLDSLRTFIEKKNLSAVPANRCDTFLHVLNEYSEFTRFYFNLKANYLAHDLSKISLTMQDEMSRKHSLAIRINYDGKDTFEIVEYDLPQQQEAFKTSSSLRVVYDQFVNVVGELQPYFSLMETLDANCWVLDPSEPKRCFKYRRIWLEENLSVIITVEPFRIWQLPEIKFLGPERCVENYRQILNRNLEKWDAKNDIFMEILQLLGLTTFPQRSQANAPQDDILWQNGDCSICYSSRLNDKLPEVVCKNSFCENCYHVECLYEWLMSVNSRRVFAQVVGHCPNCEKNISCPIPS